MHSDERTISVIEGAREDIFSNTEGAIFPNPVHDKAIIDIVAHSGAAAIIISDRAGQTGSRN